jgi:hypothetical protein
LNPSADQTAMPRRPLPIGIASEGKRFGWANTMSDRLSSPAVSTTKWPASHAVVGRPCCATASTVPIKLRATTSERKRIHLVYHSAALLGEPGLVPARINRVSDLGWLLGSKVRVKSCGAPHLAKNERDAPNFLYAALDKTACAPFFKERRMRFRGTAKLLRKSGMWGTLSFVAT